MTVADAGFELATFVVAYLIAFVLWTLLFQPLVVLFPVQGLVITGVILALITALVLLRRAGKEPP